MGELLVRNFVGVVKIGLENEKLYDKYSDCIEKISILVQRIIVGNAIHVRS